MSNEGLGLPVEGERVRIERRDDDVIVVRKADEAVVGRLDVETHGEALFVRSLCIDEVYRGFGLGSEAARLIRRAAEAGGWRALRAWAPADRGLAVYFWCRMGLRPLHGEGPDGGIGFERVIR
jgi:GNAT superfamily N-acetyltransferase